MMLLGPDLEVRCEGGRRGRGLWLLAIGRGGASWGGCYCWCCWCWCCLASGVYLHETDERRVGSRKSQECHLGDDGDI